MCYVLPLKFIIKSKVPVSDTVDLGVSIMCIGEVTMVICDVVLQ